MSMFDGMWFDKHVSVLCIISEELSSSLIHLAMIMWYGKNLNKLFMKSLPIFCIENNYKSCWSNWKDYSDWEIFNHILICCFKVQIRECQWLEHCVANLKIVGLNLAYSCVCGILIPWKITPWSHDPGATSARLNSSILIVSLWRMFSYCGNV